MIQQITTPKIGDIVYYFSYGSPGGEFPPAEPRAAIITEVGSGYQVSLFIMNPTGIFLNRAVEHSKDCKPGHWAFIWEYGARE